jgi:hypothetical protein
VDVEVDVLAGPECPADAGGIGPDLLGTQPEAGDDLLVVGVDELAGGVQVHPALAVGDRQPCLGPERSLVLHPYLVVALDHDLAPGFLVTPADPHPPEYLVPALGLFRVDQRLQLLVLDHHGPGGAPGGVEIVGGHHRHRLSPEADLVGGQHRLVGMFETEPCPTGNVALSEHGMNPADRQRRGDIDRYEPSPGVGAADGGAPQHALGMQVLGVLELTLELGDPVGSERRFAYGPGDGRLAPWCLRRSSRRLPPGQALEGPNDGAIAGAAADVPCQRFLDRLGVGVGFTLEQVDGGDHEPRGTEPALNGSGLVHRLLNRMQLVACGHPLHGHHLRSLDVGGHDQARAHQLAVEQNRTGPALALLAGVLEPGRPRSSRRTSSRLSGRLTWKVVSSPLRSNVTIMPTSPDSVPAVDERGPRMRAAGRPRSSDGR